MNLMKPTVPEVLPIIRAYLHKPGNNVGGSLHVVLDDNNIRDSDIRWCRDYALECGDEDGVKLADLLLAMSRTQRNKITTLCYRQT